MGFYEKLVEESRLEDVVAVAGKGDGMVLAGQGRKEAPEKKGFIYVPPINLYVAKQRSLLGKSWDKTHQELQQQNLQMPIIPEFIEFLKHLRQSPSNTEYQQILDDILAVRSPWRAEWFDAKFTEMIGGLQIAYGNKAEPMIASSYYDQIDFDYWLEHPTSQGLPEKGNPQFRKCNLIYYPPRKNRVAIFGVSEKEGFLDCNWNPSVESPSVGVRAVRERL